MSHVIPGLGVNEQGQIIVATGPGTVELVRKGNAGQRLTVGGSAAGGLEWVNPEQTPNNDLLGQTFDASVYAIGLTVPAVATIYVARIDIPNPLTVTNLLVNVGTLAGSTVTHALAALFKSDGTVVGQTADQSSVWGSGGSTGVKTLALTGGPFTVTPASDTDFVWGAIYVGTSAGTLPKLHASNASAATLVNAGTTTARSRYASIAQADTATLAAFTPSSLTQTNTPLWIALS